MGIRIISIAALLGILAIGCIRDSNSVSDAERERAIDAAMRVYEAEATADRDFSAGPCIAEKLEDLPGWSVDIAHDPRQDIDNQTENQCQFYRDGKTKHFVELNPDGELIRAQ